MTKPTDRVQGGEDPERDQQSGVRKVPLLSPGFREELPGFTRPPKTFGFRMPSNPADRKNLKIMIAAAVVVVIVFFSLEYKQAYEAARESKHELHQAAHDIKKSILEFLER